MLAGDGGGPSQGVGRFYGHGQERGSAETSVNRRDPALAPDSAAERPERSATRVTCDAWSARDACLGTAASAARPLPATQPCAVEGSHPIAAGTLQTGSSLCRTLPSPPTRGTLTGGHSSDHIRPSPYASLTRTILCLCSSTPSGSCSRWPCTAPIPNPKSLPPLTTRTLMYLATSNTTCLLGVPRCTVPPATLHAGHNHPLFDCRHPAST